MGKNCFLVRVSVWGNKSRNNGGGWETAISNSIAVVPNKEYVLSFEYEVFNEYSYLSGETFRVEVLSERITGNSSKHKAIAFHTIENVITPRKRVYITFTPITSTIYLMINGGYIADGLQNLKFSFNKFKLEKGNKATDWTPAPEDIDNNITDVKNSLSGFQNTVNTTFKDGIIEEAEAKAIAQHLKTLDAEKADIDKEYSTIYSNANLTGSAKTNLASAKTSFDSAHASLKSTINTVISDGRVSSSESASVTSTFNTYNTQLGVYKQRVQEALDAISSGKINSMQIGGTNLVLNSHFNYDRVWGKGKGVSWVQEGFDGGYCMKTVGALKETRNFGQNISINKLEKGQQYTATVWLKTQDVVRGTTNPHLYLYASYSLNGQYVTECALSKAIPNGTTAWTKYVLTFTTPTVNFDVMRVDGYGRDFTGIIWWDGIKLEKGNKASDWSPAPEDVDTNINNAKSEAINSANNTLTTTIANYYTKTQTDSQINIAKEAINLSVSNTYETKSNVETKVSSTLNSAKSYADTKKNEAINSASSDATTKANNALNNAKSYADTKKTEAINSAASDATSKVNSAKNELNTKIDGIQVGGRNLIKNSNKRLSSKTPTSVQLGGVVDYQKLKGKTVTLSMDINVSGMTNVSGQSNRVGFEISITHTDNTTSYIGIWHNVSDGNYNGRKTKTITVPNKDIQSLGYNGLYMQCNATSCDMGNVKLEEGNKATSWTPAPEDVDSAINKKANSVDVYTKTEVYTKDETNSQINIAKDNINLGISNTYETKANVATKVSNAVAEARGITDTRNTNQNPQWYMTNYPRQTINEFKHAHVIGIPNGSTNYGTLTTNIPWADSSGGYPVQTFKSSDYKTYERRGTSNTNWSGWVQIENATDSQAKANTAKQEAITSANNTLTTTIANYYTKVQTDSQINVAKNAITQSVSSTYETKTDSTTKYDTATAIAKAMNNGKILHEDIAFRNGSNNVSTYNNTGNGNVKVERIAKPSDCPTTSTHCIRITTTGAASPHWGGFYQNIQSRANAVFIQKFVAKVPTGYQLNVASNPMGDGYTDKWLTSDKGTGKWETYIRQVTCGSTGNFSNGGHVYAAGGTTPTASNPLVWYLAACTAIDITDTDERVSSLTTRMNSAEQKITDSAIVSTVTSSKTYKDNLTGKVDTNKIISTINQTAEAIKISASKIQLEGAVTADMITSGTFKGVNFEAGGSGNTGSVLVKDANNDNLFSASKNGVNTKRIIFADTVNNDGTFISGANTVMTSTGYTYSRAESSSSFSATDLFSFNGTRLSAESGIRRTDGSSTVSKTTLTPGGIVSSTTSNEKGSGNNSVTIGDSLIKLRTQPYGESNASDCSLDMYNNQFRIRVGGSGTASSRGFAIHGPGDKRLAEFTSVGSFELGPSDNNEKNLALNVTGKRVGLYLNTNNFGIHDWTNNRNILRYNVDNGTLQIRDKALMYSVVANGYAGMAPDGGTSAWVRTTTSGLIPYQSSGSNWVGNNSSLGTSSWRFTNGYIKEFYCNGLKNDLGDLWLSSKPNDSNATIYIQSKWLCPSDTVYTYLGSSGHRWHSVWASNGAIQTSDERFKVKQGFTDIEECYKMIKDTDIYNYIMLNQNKEDLSKNRLGKLALNNSQEQVNVHMGIMAQDIQKYKCSKQILVQGDYERADGSTDTMLSINPYGLTTAVMGALKVEIQKRELLEEKITKLESLVEQLTTQSVK